LDNVLEVRWGGELVTSAISADGSSLTQTNWTKHEFTVTATSDVTRLQFADIGTANSLGNFIDNVSVTGPSYSQITEENGCTEFTDLPFGQYHVLEEQRDEWSQILPEDNGSFDVTVSAENRSTTVNFLNRHVPSVDENYCGDGIVQTPNDQDFDEQCDGTEGVTEGFSCSLQCTLVPDEEHEVGQYALAKNRIGEGILYAGDNVTFELILSNTGVLPLTEAVMTDEFDPAILSYVSADLEPTSVTTSTLAWNQIPSAPLATSTDWRIEVTFRVNDDIGRTTTINHVNATGVVDSNENNLPDNEAQVEIPIEEKTVTPSGCVSNCGGGGGGGGGGMLYTPRILIEKSVERPIVEVGDVVLYTVVITNIGNAVGQDLTLVDQLPDGLSYTNERGLTRTWNLPPIGVGSSQTVTYEVQVGDTPTGDYVNTATASISNGNEATDDAVVEILNPKVLAIEFTELPDTGGSPLQSILLVLSVLFLSIAAISFTITIRRTYVAR